MLQTACQAQIFFALLSSLILKDATARSSAVMGTLLCIMLVFPPVLALLQESTLVRRTPLVVCSATCDL